jgi:hypothetical protein
MSDRLVIGVARMKADDFYVAAFIVHGSLAAAGEGPETTMPGARPGIR